MRAPAWPTHTLRRPDFERALYWYDTGPGVYLDAAALASMGREQEAAALMWTRKDIFHMWPPAMNSLHAYLERDYSRCIAAIEQGQKPEFFEPEGCFYVARQAAKVGATELANRLLLRSIEMGLWCTTSLTHDPWLQSLRATPEFRRVFDLAKSREAQSQAAFVEAGGESVLCSRS